jgi:hypothetical protein
MVTDQGTAHLPPVALPSLRPSPLRAHRREHGHSDVSRLFLHFSRDPPMDCLSPMAPYDCLPTVKDGRERYLESASDHQEQIRGIPCRIFPFETVLVLSLLLLPPALPPAWGHGPAPAFAASRLVQRGQSIHYTCLSLPALIIIRPSL